MKKFRLFTIPAAALLVFSHVASADAGGDNWSISGWINEGMTWYSDGANSDIVQTSDNGKGGSRVMLSGNVDLPNTGLNAGFEVIFQPQAENSPLGADQNNFGDSNFHRIGILGNSLNLSGGFGKFTFGLQTMPTDNIAVLADPSMTLWSAVSLVIRANGFTINKGGSARWGDFLNCFTAPGLRGAGGIGIDCNGIYRQGVRYDLPSFGPLSVAVGWANDDIYDIAAKYNGELGGLKTMLHLGYAINQGVNPNATVYHNKARNFQAQLGLMDPGTGIFGTFAYQHETADVLAARRSAAYKLSDKTHAWWTKVGIKRAFNSLGDTAISFQYGNYNDQYGLAQARNGVTGSRIKRMGFAVDQYFGSRLIIYGAWENLGLDVEGSAEARGRYGSADNLNIFSAGLTFFF